MAVERLSVEEVIPLHPARMQAPELPLTPPKSDIAEKILTASLGIFHALGVIVATRLLLLMVLSGAFALSVMAVQDAGYHGLFVFIAYSVLIVLPIVWLDQKQRSPRQ